MSEHIVSPKIYVTIFLALMILTGTTYYAAQVDLNQYFASLNMIVALAIAACKAALVILFFMHVYYSTKLTKLTVAAGFFWLMILITLSLSDYLSRAFDLGQ